MQQIREVGRQVAEVTVREVDRSGGHAERLDVVASRRIAEAGDAPDVVVGRKRSGEAERDAPGGTGDQDLLTAQHGRTPVPRTDATRSVRSAPMQPPAP